MEDPADAKKMAAGAAKSIELNERQVDRVRRDGGFHRFKV